MPANDALAAATQYFRAGNHVAAERAYRQALAVSPNNAEAWCHFGTCCLIQNRPKEALEAYEKATSIQPQFPEAFNNMGVALAKLDRFDEAVGIFHRAASQRPGWAGPYVSLGNLLLNHDRYDEATECFVKYAQTETNNPEAHNLLGSVLAKQGMIDEAIPRFLEAIRLSPRYEMAHSNALLAMNYDPNLSPGQLYIEHRWWDRLHGQGMGEVPKHQNNRDPDRCLRVGYISPDFRKHVVASFLLPIFEAHDPKQVKVFAYSEITQSDAYTQRFRDRCFGWQQTQGRKDAQVVEQIRADEIDILVDLAGHTGGSRLKVFAHRPAPVQITYLGYPNTTGLSTIDYRLTDAIADPPGEPVCHSEELVRLLGPFCCYLEPENAPEIVPPPVQKNGFTTFGLLHKQPKLNAPMLDLWADVMKRVPNSRVLMFRNTMDKSSREKLTSEFVRRGIAVERIMARSGTAKGLAHLAQYNEVDISLDSLPWSGHATTCESLWMGVPMVSLLGDRHAGRMSASILTAAGMQEMIARSKEEYLKIAIDLANDMNRLTMLRKELRGRMKASALCDAAGFTRGLETVYRDLWRRWCAREPVKT